MENLTNQEKKHMDEILNYISNKVEKDDPDYGGIVDFGLDDYFSELK